MDLDRLELSIIAGGFMAILVVLAFLFVQGTFFHDEDQWLDWCSSSSMGDDIFYAEGCTYDVANEFDVGDDFVVWVDAYEGSTLPSPDEMNNQRNFYVNFVELYFEENYGEVGVVNECFDYVDNTRLEICGSNHVISQWEEDHGEENRIVNPNHGETAITLRSNDFMPILEEIGKRSSCEASFTGYDSDGNSVSVDKQGDFAFTDRGYPACEFNSEDISSVEAQSFDLDIEFVARFGDMPDQPDVDTGQDLDYEGVEIEKEFVDVVEHEFEVEPFEISMDEPVYFQDTLADVYVFDDQGSVVHSEEGESFVDARHLNLELPEGDYEGVLVFYYVTADYDWVSEEWEDVEYEVIDEDRIGFSIVGSNGSEDGDGIDDGDENGETEDEGLFSSILNSLRNIFRL